MPIGGLAVPTPTLFGPDGSLHPGWNSRFTRALCEAGVEHIFTLGTLGEFPSITEEERGVLLESVIESLTPGADAWVGCGAPSTAQAVRYAEQAEEAGAAVLLAVPPYFLRPTPEAIDRYYRTLRRAVKIPLLAYNIPSHVGYALRPEWAHAWFRDGVIQGVKDTSGSLESVRSFLASAPPGFALLPGDDALALDAIRAGATGAIMGIGNVVPRLAVELVSRARAGEWDRAEPLQKLATTFARALALGPFPAAGKRLVETWRGLEVGYRSPYDAPTPEEESRVAQALQPFAEELRRYV